MNSGTLLSNANLFELSPDHIDEGERIGFLHQDKAAALGRLMAVDGQRDPIKVAAQPNNPEKPWRLVTGMHRLIGARIESITIWAIEVSGTAEDLADLEASENLHRRPLGPIERAKFTAALVIAAQDRIARQHGNLKQQQLAQKARWDRVKSNQIRANQALQEESEDTCATLAHVYGWEDSVGEALDMSRRTIHRDLKLYRLLVEPFPDLIRALADHPIVGENAAQLKIIAEVVDQPKRRQAIELLLGDDALSADAACARLGIKTGNGGSVTPLPHQKFFDQIKGGWTRLGTAQKRQFLPDIAAMMPDGMKRELRDILNEQIGD